VQHVHLVGSDEVGAVERGHRPVLDRLAVRTEPVLLLRQPAAHSRPDAGLLDHLAARRIERVLAALELALRHRPVVVPGPVHEADLEPVGPAAPQHAARRADQHSGHRRYSLRLACRRIRTSW
jgi:hypothetical protein